MTNKYKLVLPFLALLLTATPADAQKKGNSKKKAKTEKKTENKPTAAELLREYRFEEAEAQLNKELEKNRKDGKTDAQLEADLRQAQMGADMLRGTEKVIIIDSMVVKHEQMLDAINIDRECGSIIRPADIPGLKLQAPTGASAFINELGDRVVYAQAGANGCLKLVAADKLGEEWAQPVHIIANSAADDIQDFPFMMTDGVTLYFAAQGDESLGGYDIFVTRYDKENGTFLKAENMGMPFNSPANDYLMVIDEPNNIGWFVTDREQAPGNVCIYRFIPNTTREVYDLNTDDEEKVRRMARISSVAESHTDARALAAARKRIAEAGHLKNGGSSEHHRFVVNDRTVYTQFSQFRSDAARRHAVQLVIWYGQYAAESRQLDALRRQYGRQPAAALKDTILRLESKLDTMRRDIEQEEAAMRQAELQALNQ